ncbi:MAG: hypothetical protein Q8L37_04810 [Candidatus Gottesmanbacteria bacterium]|nr:hypothetical protein [Candidatus Gottesmanbacteria bacterium]
MKLKKTEKLMFKHYIAITVLNIVVFCSIVAGFIIGGSPTELKDIGYDTTRINAFTQIFYAIENYYRSNKAIPETLTLLNIQASMLKDPQTSKLYVYTKQNNSKYDLCTIFSTDSEKMKQKYTSTAMPLFDYQAGATDNTHKKGYDCISYDMSKITSNIPTQQLQQDSRQLENQALFALKDATFDATPRDAINRENGYTTSGNIKLLITTKLSNIYEIKDNSKEYLVALQTTIMSDGNYEEFKTRCWNKSNSNIFGCHYNIQDIDFVSSTGKSLRKNREGSADYTVSKNYGNLSTYGDFSNNNKDLFGGSLLFYAPKQDFTDDGKPVKFYIKNFNKGWDTISQPNDIEISILIK